MRLGALEVEGRVDANSLAGQRGADRLLVLQSLLRHLHILGVDSVDVAPVMNPERLERLGTSREREECSHQNLIIALRRRAGASRISEIGPSVAGRLISGRISVNHKGI